MSIDDIRHEIDEIDNSVLELLSRRAKNVLEIGRLKEQTQRAVFDAGRERRIIDRLIGLNPGPLGPGAVRDIFGAIIAAHRALEKQLVVAYYGPAGTFTHIAARGKFGSGAQFDPYDTIADVFVAVEKKEADLGVVPIENTTAGVVPFTLDALMDSKLQITAEVYVDIEHYLLSHERDLNDVVRVYSHPQPLAQCRLWLRANLPRAELIPVGTTARAAEVAAKEAGSAAIGPALAGELHDLPVLVPRMHDQADNRTRFFVMGNASSPASGHDKTSLVFSLHHEAGALFRALQVLASHGINMTFIQSHPTRQTQWEYLFFVDVEGHADTPSFAAALEELRRQTLAVRVLGSYPEAE
jgi:chorismate mutase / prephenate dehydratase